MSWDDGLTGTARNIAATNDSPLRVMAGPGTGKSFAMKRRIARLLENGQEPRRILAVTFTRNAASSLLSDLHALGIEDCERVRVGTLHAFCFSLLSRQDVFEYLGRVPRPVVTFSKSGVLQFEGGAMLTDLSGGVFGPKRDCTQRIRAFEAAWARLQNEEPGWPQDHIDRQFQGALISWLRFHQAILIGELVPEAHRFLRNNPASEALTAFDHVVVDEFQDLNKAEQELIDLLAENGSLAIVGDVDQSIYRFRYANPEGIESFGQEHPDTHDETLDECRRCPTLVVSMANYLICHNHPASETTRLQPLPGNPEGAVHIVQWGDVAHEARGIAGFVRTLVCERGYSPGDILVLTPRRSIGYGVRDQLTECDIAVHSFYHEEALEGDAAQQAFAILTLMVNQDDRVALRWWLGHGSASNRKNAYLKLRQHCELTDVSPRNALEMMLQRTLNIPGTNDLLNKYRELKERLARLEGQNLDAVVNVLLPDGNDECSVLREVALLAVTDDCDVAKLMDRIRTHITQPEMPEEGDFVRVMSLHKSKGLTSKVAIVAGCMQGMIPFIKDDEPLLERNAILQEQRRLFYVAITRCTETLVLSSIVRMERQLAHRIGAQLRAGGGMYGNTIASQFIDELGPDAPAARRGERWAEAGYI
ncbi:MAG: ATP-dependent helicase [Desulfuromonadaceae bacterium]|nr:ATP-dependent helicase [Desulfuromonadaceae bacterium]